MKSRVVKAVLIIAAAWFGATPAMAALDGAASPSKTRRCASNQGPVAGVVAIHNLQAKRASCRKARRVVKRFHAKFNGSYQKYSFRVLGFRCHGRMTGGYEGLIVSCRRANQRIRWIGQLAL